MPAPSVVTGRKIGSDTCEPAVYDACLLLHPGVDTDTSHVFDVVGAKLITVFDMASGEEIRVEMVAGENAGDLFAPLVIGGKQVGAAYPNTTIVIPMPGRYRLKFVGIPGEVTAMCSDIECCTAALLNNWQGGLTI